MKNRLLRINKPETFEIDIGGHTKSAIFEKILGLKYRDPEYRKTKHVGVRFANQETVYAIQDLEHRHFESEVKRKSFTIGSLDTQIDLKDQDYIPGETLLKNEFLSKFGLQLCSIQSLPYLLLALKDKVDQGEIVQIPFLLDSDSSDISVLIFNLCWKRYSLDTFWSFEYKGSKPSDALCFRDLTFVFQKVD